MGCCDQLGRGRFLQGGQGHRELDGDGEAAFLAGGQHHLGLDLDVLDLELLPAGDRGQGALEAGCVADGEELLGIGPVTVAAQLGRRAEIDLQQAVAGATVPGDPAAGDMRFCRVEDLADAFSVAAGFRPRS